MSNADRIGYLPFAGWLVSGPLAATLFAWLLTPVGLYVLAYFLESRLVGRDFRLFKGAFWGFMPGDLFLGASFGQFIWQFEKFKNSPEWCRSWWWHLVVACGATAVGLLIREQNDRPNYVGSAMKSPTKLYHDFVIYIGFGYVFFSTIIAATFATGWDSTLWLPYLLLASWVLCLVRDGIRSKEELRQLAAASHPDYGWSKPIWR